MKNNSNVGFTYQLNPKSIFEQFVEHKGLFWGIKLYVALGYPPYIGCGDDYHAIFPKLSKDSYSGFIVFLEDCAKEKIPITCHASPQGMTIADSEIYLKEYLKTNKKSSYYTAGKSNFDPNIKGMYLGFGIIDDFSSPDSWRIVLSKIEKYSLRLCLAHFGGKPFFTNEYEMDSNKPYCWQDKLGQLIKDYENKHEIYTDLSNYMFNPVIFPCVLPDFTFKRLFENSKLREYFDKTTKNHYSQSFDYYKCRLPLNNIENCIDKEQKRAALQICFIMLENGIIGKDINAAASKLAELISKYPVLQYRIMYGTDYPLSENGGVKGVENYQSSTFIFYQLVTHKLGSKWDVWHQFCVINPLKFLGLLKLEGEEYKFDATKLIKFKENLITYNAEIKDTYIRTNRWGLEEVNTVKNVIDSKFNEFINTNSDSDLKNELNGKVIPKAEEMVDEDNCLIITGEKVNWNEN
jgi:hypothetical protein